MKKHFDGSILKKSALRKYYSVLSVVRCYGLLPLPASVINWEHLSSVNIVSFASRQCHLAFYSMLGPRLLLGYPAIQAIREAKTLDLFNNAITVTTVDGQTHFFTSFLTRDKVCLRLTNGWRIFPVWKNAGQAEL